MPDSTNFSERILGPGDHASRPSASAVPEGTLYSCTDHGLVYVQRAAAWGTWVSASGGGSETQVITYRSSATTGTNSGTSVVITKPASTASGDLLIASLAHFGDAGTITPGAGFTLLRTTTQTTHPAEEVNTYTLVAGGSEPADYTFSWVNLVGVHWRYLGLVQRRPGRPDRQGRRPRTDVDDNGHRADDHAASRIHETRLCRWHPFPTDIHRTGWHGRTARCCDDARHGFRLDADACRRRLRGRQLDGYGHEGGDGFGQRYELLELRAAHQPQRAHRLGPSARKSYGNRTLTMV